MPADDWNRLGVGALRDASISNIEDAIAKALSDLVGRRFSVSLSTIEFEGAVGSAAEVTLRVSDPTRSAWLANATKVAQDPTSEG